MRDSGLKIATTCDLEATPSSSLSIFIFSFSCSFLFLPPHHVSFPIGSVSQDVETPCGIVGMQLTVFFLTT